MSVFVGWFNNLDMQLAIKMCFVKFHQNGGNFKNFSMDEKKHLNLVVWIKVLGKNLSF